MTEDNSLIDSNILVYAFDNSEKEKHIIARKLLDSIFNDNKIPSLKGVWA